MNAHRTTSVLIRLLILLLILSSFTVRLGFAQASPNPVSDFFVSTSGSGSACTQASPCDLATALSLAGGGSFIYVAAGTYTGSGAEVIRLALDVKLYGGWDGARQRSGCAQS